MGISEKLLSEGEHVIASTRTHWKALVLPVIFLIITCALAGFLLAVLPSGDTHDPLMYAVITVAVLVIIWLTLRPFLIWLTASYTVTNRRLINRSGVFTRSGRDIPLHRINDVKYERDLLDRLLGCGTLVISDASENGRSVLPDVPRVEKLQLVITDLLFGNNDGHDDDGTPPHPLEPRPR
ncbi:MAG: PH domain-containing protein [Nocardioidaceae bacterium]|nr:PH domain-containing protein [Nocardioidaceae bacterium]